MTPFRTTAKSSPLAVGQPLRIMRSRVEPEAGERRVGDVEQPDVALLLGEVHRDPAPVRRHPRVVIGPVGAEEHLGRARAGHLHQGARPGRHIREAAVPERHRRQEAEHRQHGRAQRRAGPHRTLVLQIPGRGEEGAVRQGPDQHAVRVLGPGHVRVEDRHPPSRFRVDREDRSVRRRTPVAHQHPSVGQHLVESERGIAGRRVGLGEAPACAPSGASVARAPSVTTTNRSGPANSIPGEPAARPRTGMAMEAPPAVGTLRGPPFVPRYAIDWPSGEKLMVVASSVPSSRCASARPAGGCRGPAGRPGR